MKKIYIYIIAGILTLSSTSCNDYLDVSGELTNNLTIEAVFENPNYTRRWYSRVYQSIPNYAEMGLGATSGYTGIWNIIAGEVTTARGPGLGIMTSGFNAFNAEMHKYWTCYVHIRQSLIFLEYAPESLGQASDTHHISVDEMERMKAEIKYLLAYNYFQLFELYGPVPIVTEIADPEDRNLDYARAPIDDVIGYIDGLLQQVIASNHIRDTHIARPEAIAEGERYDLRQIARPTKVAAYALRARLWTYAASPLFNGGYQEALSITNYDGTRLFPDRDPQKWVKAKQYLEDFLKFAEDNAHKLFYSQANSSGEVDAHRTVYELYQYYNDEIIWANPNNSFNNVTTNMEPRTTPRDIYSSSFGNVGIFQESVDAFFMDNGLDINHPSSGYSKTGFGDLKNVIRNNRNENVIDKHISMMFHNREPRFYNSITYEGRSWFMPVVDVKTQPVLGDYRTFFSKGGGADNSLGENPRTGYMLFKFKNRSLLNVGTNNKSWGRPWMLMRLADFYLLYAEVCNEINPSDSKIIEYLDLVRVRAGIPGYKTLAEGGVLDIRGSQELQRNAIQRERQVELFAEGNRYFDIRRWMIADDARGSAQQLIRTGLNMDVAAARWRNGVFNGYLDDDGPGSFYEPVVIERRAWTRQMLLYPIPYNEVQKSRLVVQNPGW